MQKNMRFLQQLLIGSIDPYLTHEQHLLGIRIAQSDICRHSCLLTMSRHPVSTLPPIILTQEFAL